MTLGVIMLETAFRRFPGDIGAPESHAGPVLFETVPGASARRIVGIADDTFLAPFVAAGERLVERGATLITTSCGYLAVYQRALASRLPVPVATSALLLLPTLAVLAPAGGRVGVLTFSATSLSAAHLAVAGAAPDTACEGLREGGVFQRAILDGADDDSYEGREAEAVAAARRLVARHPDVVSIVLECTNLPPHRAAIAAATGLPVHDLWSLLALAAGRRLDRDD